MIDQTIEAMGEKQSTWRPTDAEQANEAAKRAIRERTTAFRQTEGVMVRYDRPLHRRKHEVDIAAATRDIRRLPRLIEDARNDANNAAQRIEQIRVSSRKAVEVLKRRPSHAANVAAIDDRVSGDLRVRTRVARLEQPKAITGALGDRPPPGPASRNWDLAAGHLAQHQATFGIDDGFGPRSGHLDDSAYCQSRASAIEKAEPFIRSVAPPSTERTVPEFGR